MKNLIKKIMVGMFGFALLFSAQNAFATSTWNQASNDCKSISIVNASTNEGYASPCWTGTSVSAQGGDVLNIRIYYHNTGTVTATNTKILLTPSVSIGTSSSTKSFTGRIVSDQGSLSFGPVSASISSSQSLSFISAKWYTNNTSETLTSLLNGQSGSEVIGSNGLEIGSITPGWSSQGSVVIAFKISSTVAPQLCKDTSAINYNGALPCQYPAQVCRDTSATNYGGALPCVYPQLCKDPSATNYNGALPCQYPPQLCKDTSAINYNGALPCQYPAQVCRDTSATNYGGALPCVYPQPVCVISSFTANHTSITLGDSVILSWGTSNCTSISIDHGVGSVSSSGSTTVYPPYTKTYTLTATGATGTQTKSVYITVNTPSIMTGVINALSDSCVISSRNSSCPISFSWSTQNPEATSSVTHDSSTVATGNNGSKSFSISYGSKSYYLYNNSKLLDSDTVSATCTSGTSWNGSYCASVAVNNCTINSFTASPSSITSGETSSLNWSTSNCTNVTISNISYGLPTSGSQAVWPTSTKTYTLIAYASNGSTQTRTATVYVNQPSVCVINNFTASPSSITSGDSSLLNWSTSDCENVTISNLGYNVPTSGSQAVWPTQTTTYTLTAHSSTGATQTRTATVSVNQPTQNCSINNFTASPSSIEKGDSSLLNWNTTNCTSVTISNISYGLPTSGSQAVWPTSTKTYTLIAYASNGSTQTRTATVYVDENNNNNECSIDSFTASDTSIEEGDSTTIKWSTSNCDHVKISNIGSVNDDGSEKVYPDNDTTYTITAYNTDGSSETDTVRVYVDNNNNNNECSIDSFTSNKINVNSGDSVTIRWSTSDCDDVSISGIGDVAEDGSEVVYPTYTRTYTLRASADNDESKSITINVNNYNPVYPPITPIYNTNVVTMVATNISQTSAQFNGLVTSSNYANTSVYFEYGASVNMGSRTLSRPTTGNDNFNEYVSGLSPNTIYYFQAVSEGVNGISRGSIQVFKTLPYATGVITTPIRKVIVQGPTVTSSSSPIVLRIENKYQAFGVGDIIDYTVYYKNISSSKLTNPMVQVFIPQGITLLNTSRGTYSEDNRTLSVPIEDLLPGAEGVIYLQGRVDSLDANLAQIVTTAILVYTNPNGAQENAMAYVLNNPRVMVNMLGASAFSGNIFGVGLIGWLLLIILILLLVLVARSIYGHRVVTTTTHTIN